MARRFLCDVSAPVVKLTETPLFQDEVVNKGYVDDMFDLRGLPPGGTAGQALLKVDGTDYNADWETLSLEQCFPFYDRLMANKKIPLVNGLLPFFKSNGNASPIPIIGC